MRKKIICFLMTTILSANMSGIVSAETIKVRIQDGVAYPVLERYASINASSVDSKVIPIIETQARHKKGTQTTIGVSKSVTKSVTTSAKITGSYGVVAWRVDASFGLDNTSSTTVTASISYTLTNEKSGRYRIETVFPGKKVVCNVYEVTQYMTKKIYSKTISYRPKKNAAYKRLKRYAG